mmetsp:Transcript_15058/g.33146  ORF Transcript_15058/g.33146 Transcript_15058/m.33146 type:complete len:211 (+) Transcript_15058:707-1339(+)
MRRNSEGFWAVNTVAPGLMRRTWVLLLSVCITFSSWLSGSPKICTNHSNPALFGAVCSFSSSGSSSSAGPSAGVRLMLNGWGAGHSSTLWWSSMAWAAVASGTSFRIFSSAQARAWATVPVNFMGSAPLWARLFSTAARRRRTTEEKQTWHPSRLALITKFTSALTPLASTAGTVSKSRISTFKLLFTNCSWMSRHTLMAVPKKKYPVSQ